MSKPRSNSADAPIHITMGEPSGIGPEVAVAAYHALGGKYGARKLKLVGDPEVFGACGVVPDDALIPTGAKAKRVPGTLNVVSAPAVIEAIELSVKAAMAGEAGAVVTAPIHKWVLTESGFEYPGHTEFLEHLTGAKRAVMMMASDKLKVVPLTIHIPVREVPSRLSKERIVETGEIMLDALKKDFGVANPRLAVAGLNPHAGEAGTIGLEEDTIISPAIEALSAAGNTVLGPLSADAMFHDEARAQYDAALCMYHDQALIPSKTLAFWDGVNVTLGLPIVRTSPDHGTALDIAGTGKADVRSMIAAIKCAAQMADARG
ncbi:MAG TPA: 4-hydroxythreonine-4-phosphate dehydrogenase PdxA [Rhizomicrobium sp.]|nr:4-hydroxythreonine-4-phosphate dehydrogenase PdxA [Rhizomicrobium sp.]